MALTLASFKDLLSALEAKYELAVANSSRKGWKSSDEEDYINKARLHADSNAALEQKSSGPCAPPPAKPELPDVLEGVAIPEVAFIVPERINSADSLVLSSSGSILNGNAGNSLDVASTSQNPGASLEVVASSFTSKTSRASIRSGASTAADFNVAHVWLIDPPETDMAEAGSALSTEVDVLEGTVSGTIDLYKHADKHLRFRRSDLVSDPNSVPRTIWTIFGAILVMYDVILLPLKAFPLPYSWQLDVMDQIILAYFTLDILASFFVGYTDKSGDLVMQLGRIALHYIRSWFLPDLLLVACDWTVLIISVSQTGDVELGAFGLARAAKVPRMLRVIRALRFFRLGKFRSLKHSVSAKIDSEHLALLFRATGYILIIVLLNHVLACSWYWLGTYSPGDSHTWVHVYEFAEDTIAFKSWTCMHWAITQFTPGSMDVQPQNTKERIMTVFVLMFGLLVFSTFVSSITSGMTRLYNDKKKVTMQIWKLRRYLKQNRVHRRLALRVNRYVHLMLSSQKGSVQSKDVELLNLLSRPLHVELVTAIHRRFLVVHPFLERLEVKDHAVLRKLCDTAVEIMNLAASDTLFSVGGRCGQMFFLTAGLLNYEQQRKNSVPIPVYKGLWFCEAVLWTRWVHRGNMKAKFECELIAVVASKFQDIVSQECVNTELPRSYARIFVQALKSLQDLYGNGSLSDLQVELLHDDNIVRILQRPPREKTSTQAGATRGILRYAKSV